MSDFKPGVRVEIVDSPYTKPGSPNNGEFGIIVAKVPGNRYFEVLLDREVDQECTWPMDENEVTVLTDPTTPA